MDKKVYCINCLNLKRTKADRCHAPKNMKEHVRETWLERSVAVKPRRLPSVINKGNDCRWYVEKVKQ